MIRGVVEGFYGRPYTASERDTIISYLSMLDDPVYMYAPKNDPYHRLKWRQEYPCDSFEALAANIRKSRQTGVKFIFGISPWQFTDDDAEFIQKKADKALSAGAFGICILFDDVPDKADPELAFRQIELAEKALADFDCQVYMCPSIYCSELMEILNGEEYLHFLKDNLPERWNLFWTGEAVISRKLDSTSLVRAEELLGRQPVLWDNLLADDYTLRRIFLGGLVDRIPCGHSFLLNPSSCFPAALHAVHEILLASGIENCWPAELGNDRTTWKLLGEFHHLPWSAGIEVEELLRKMSAAIINGSSEGLMKDLERISSTLDRFVEYIQDVQGGLDLMPYIMDVGKLIGWWTKALLLPTLPQRVRELRYLMLERLPFEHPLAANTAAAVSRREE
ncbi:MAG: beta-N-acetylglucosaminidase domain-containing protein [Candidatus Aegiribacteria sp.]|nr:beta-N-acetylglucosaminidase domain-containing protein [Candidatus Aegiribacteria sp.]